MIATTTQSNMEPACPVLARPSLRRILFASAHSIVDFSNGASVATLDVLQVLATASFNCQAFCTSRLDFQHEVSLEQIVSCLDEPYQIQPLICGGENARLLFTRRQRVPITVVRLESSRHARQSPEEVRNVLRFFEKFLETYAPDVMITYGGDPTTHGMIRMARERRIPVVFMIHNFGYRNAKLFPDVDYCIVASEFARRQYRETVGLDCQTLPYPIDWDRVTAESREARFVTFVNPCLEKGVYPFARIADELGRRRPDIPLLVVESRGTRDTAAACGIDPDARGNITFMPHTTDCRRFWALTKLALMPSLWWENQPLVAVEAMINGIPVIGSDRGGIPETLGASGFALPLPERLTPASKIVPSAEEVEPWVETVIRLWDDDSLYQEQSALAKREAQRWHPDRLRPRYAEFFSNVRMQPGTPFVWRTAQQTARLAPALESPHSNAAAPQNDPRNMMRKSSRRMIEDRLKAGLQPESAPAFVGVPASAGLGALDVHAPRGEVAGADSNPLLEAAREPGRLGASAAAPHPDPLPRERGKYLRAKRGGISFVVCVSDDAILKANLLASPGLVGPSSPHEVILIHKAPSAADGLNMGLDRAQRDQVAFVHQDVLLPEGWDRCLTEQLREAEHRFGPIGVAGVYGVGAAVGLQSKGYTLGAQRVGWVVDRGRTLREAPELPARVATLDELLLVRAADTPRPVRPRGGFHMYGADICLQAAEHGLAVVAWVRLCEHNSRSVGLPKAFFPRRSSPASGPIGCRWRHHASLYRPRRKGVPAGEHTLPAATANGKALATKKWKIR